EGPDWGSGCTVQMADTEACDCTVFVPPDRDREFREFILMYRVELLKAYDQLCEGVTTEKLLTLIWDFNDFGPVIEKYMEGMGKSEVSNRGGSNLKRQR